MVNFNFDSDIENEEDSALEIYDTNIKMLLA